MRESSTSQKAKAKAVLDPRLDLELPIDPNFDSRPPKLSPSEYYHWCMEMRKGCVDDPAERLATKVRVEFVL